MVLGASNPQQLARSQRRLCQLNVGSHGFILRGFEVSVISIVLVNPSTPSVKSKFDMDQ